jgi:hypothetical protein
MKTLYSKFMKVFSSGGHIEEPMFSTISSTFPHKKTRNGSLYKRRLGSERTKNRVKGELV